MIQRKCFKQLAGITIALIGMLAYTRQGNAQSVPLPFASTYVGGGTACSSGILTWVISGTGKNYGDGCPAAQATLSAPSQTVIDNNGNMFIADQTDDLVRVVYQGGTALANAIIAANVQTTGLTPKKGYVYTIAGGVTSSPSSSPYYCNQAGSGTLATNKQLDGCPGVQAYVQPRGLAVDRDGNVFISSIAAISSLRVFYVGGTAAAKLITLENPTITSPIPGYVYNLAGSANLYGGDGSLASSASVSTPRSLWVDANENIYFADGNNSLIRRIDGSTGKMSTVAGATSGCTSGSSSKGCTAAVSAGDGGPAASAQMNYTYGVVFDSNGNMFIADSGSGTAANGRIRVVYAGGTLPGISNPQVGYIYTYAGGGTSTTSGVAATSVQFEYVYGVSIDNAGYLYVTDSRFTATGSTGANHIWRIDPGTGIATIIAGSGGSAYASSGLYCNGGTAGPTNTNTKGDGCPATEAYLNAPQGEFVFDSNGNAYLADRSNNVIRSFSWNNRYPAVTVGSSTTQAQAFYLQSGVIPATVSFQMQGGTTSEYSDAGAESCPLGTSLTAASTCVFYTRFTPIQPGLRQGMMQVNASAIASTLLTGTGTAASLSLDPATITALISNATPQAITADTQGNVYVTDTTSDKLLKVTLSSGATTTILAGLSNAHQSAIDGGGNLYVADTGNNRVIEQLTSGSTVTLGNGLNAPQGIALDALGNVYVADTGNSRIVMISVGTGVQTTLALYGLATALNGPTYLSFDVSGNLYIVDSGNQRIVQVPMAGAPQALTIPVGITPSAIVADNAGNLYIGDSTGLQIIEEAGASSVMTTTVVTGLKSITGLSIDAGGSLYFTDSSAGQAFSYNRNVGALSFPTTNKGQTSLPLSLTLSNSGNTSLTLSTPVSTLTSGLANFTIGTGSNNGCSSAQVLTAAANCQESISFAPTTTGLLTAQASFLSSAFNTAVANFSGNAVNLIVTNASLMITSPATTPVTLGENVVVKAVITPTSSSGTMSGTVYFVVDGVAQASQPVGVGTFTIAQTFTVGTHIIGINYSGDATYAPCNSSISITVTKVPTSMVVTNTFGVGGQDTTAVVTPTTITNGAMTGTITFTVDGIAKSPISIGSGTVTGVFALADGTHIITADYSGDSTYAASTASITITVARIVTTLKLSNVLGAGGQNATLVVSPASSNGAMTGTVIFTIDGVAQSPVPIGSGSVNAVFSLADGAHTIAASYSGDGVYEPGATSINISVSRISTTTSLSVAAGAGGQAATVVVIPSNTTNGAMTGTITITIDGVAQAPVAIGSGTVTSTYVLVDGTHNLTASYSGDGVYHPSTSNSETVTVLHASTNTALNITTTANTGSAGLLLTASVTSTAKGTITGTVTFYNNGSAIGTGTVNNSGIAMLTTNKVSYTSFVFSASYGGDGNYLSSSSPNVTENADFAVVPPTTALVVAQGGQAVASISLVSVNGYSGTLTAVCGNLPANTICNFQPSTISLSPTGNTTVSLEVFSNVNPATARTTEHIQPLYLAFAIAVPLALSFLTAARKRCHGLSLLAAFVLFIVLTGIQGCSSTNAPYVTPGGTQTVTITLTDSTGLSHSGTMSLTVAAVQ